MRRMKRGTRWKFYEVLVSQALFRNDLGVKHSVKQRLSSLAHWDEGKNLKERVSMHQLIISSPFLTLNSWSALVLSHTAPRPFSRLRSPETLSSVLARFTASVHFPMVSLTRFLEASDARLLTILPRLFLVKSSFCRRITPPVSPPRNATARAIFLLTGVFLLRYSDNA